MKNQIAYKDIIDLGFEVEEVHDQVYENQYGYPYKIFTKKLTKKIYVDWQQTTRLCTLTRIDKNYSIKAQRPINNLEHLKDIIEFFGK